MVLVVSSVLSIVILFILLSVMGPLIGGIVTIGIVLGVLFQGLYLINDIHKRISKITPSTDKVSEAVTNYLKELDE